MERQNFQSPKPRKEYSAPKVLHTEKIETRAVVCAKADVVSCADGPLQSRT